MDKAWFTDVDKTLMSSNKQLDSYGVAYRDYGLSSSFMSPWGFETLYEITQTACVVPCTTRVLPAWNRCLLKTFFPFALLQGGAQLFCDDETLCKEWMDESRELAADAFVEFENVRTILTEAGNYPIKYSDEFIIEFFIDTLSEKELSRLFTFLDSLSSDITVCTDSKHLYRITYSALSKGSCCTRFANLMNKELFLSSGDSKIDETMFGTTLYSIGRKNATFNFDCKGINFCDCVIRKAGELLQIL